MAIKRLYKEIPHIIWLFLLLSFYIFLCVIRYNVRLNVLNYTVAIFVIVMVVATQVNMMMDIVMMNVKKNMLTLLYVSLFGVFAMVVAGCGQKGALYLPDSQSTIEQGYEKDGFLLPEIQQRIDNIQNDPTDF